MEAPQDTAINDDFAKTLGLESLDKLKEAARERLTAEFASATRQRVKRMLLDRLDESHRFEAPPSLVDEEFNLMWNSIKAEMESGGKTFADENTTEEAAREEYRKIADLGQHQAEPDPAIGNLAVLLPGGLFGGVLIGKGLAAGFHLGLDRVPHQIEFFIDQGGRRLEAVAFIEAVQQRPLDPLAGGAGKFGREPLARRLLQLVERFKAKRLGKVVVDRGVLRRFDQCGGGFGTGPRGRPLLAGIVLREGDSQAAGFAGRNAEQLLFEAGNECV